MFLIFGAYEFNDCTQRNAAGLPNRGGTKASELQFSEVTLGVSHWICTLSHGVCENDARRK